MDGIFNINKATGMTSHDVVAKVRKLIKQKGVGHAGTLDPAASGVLPICVGEATRVAEYLSASGKAYTAKIIFGSVTDTYDAEGTITRTASTADLTLAHIEEALRHFVGPQMQVPPRYSAIKLQGQPAYKRARAGEAITLEARPIVIHALEVIDWKLPGYLTLAVECGKGTYIRSLAYDLGERLGCGAYLDALVRTRSGPFPLSASITLEQLDDAMSAAHSNGMQMVDRYLYPMDIALEHLPALVLDAAGIERVRHGNVFRYEEHISKPQEGERNGVYEGAPLQVRVYDDAGQFVAIAQWNEDQGLWKPKKVFAISRLVC